MCALPFSLQYYLSDSAFFAAAIPLPSCTAPVLRTFVSYKFSGALRALHSPLGGAIGPADNLPNSLRFVSLSEPSTASYRSLQRAMATHENPIPLLDFSNATPEELAPALLKAVQTVVFLHCKGLGPTAEQVRNMFAISTELFSSPRGELDACPSDGRCGYTAFGANRLDVRLPFI